MHTVRCLHAGGGKSRLVEASQLSLFKGGVRLGAYLQLAAFGVAFAHKIASSAAARFVRLGVWVYLVRVFLYKSIRIFVDAKN